MKKNISVWGMHCSSCELILEKEISQLKWVEVQKINHKNGKIELEIQNEEQLSEVQKIIEENGFTLWWHILKKRLDFQDIMIRIIVTFALLIWFYLFHLFDIYRFLPDTQNMSFSGAFLVWVIASLSSCLVITGGIIIGFSRYFDASSRMVSHVWVQSLFQLWRLAWFFIFGGILGYLGSIVELNLWFTGVLTFLVGGILLYMGLYILGLVPNISRFGLTLPKSIVSKLEASSHPLVAPFVGAGTFFLPCWFTQSLQLLAISTGDFLSWALIMFFFALGTFPVLFSVWLGSSYFKGKKFPLLNMVIWIIVVVFGLITLVNSYNLLWVWWTRNTQETWIEIQENKNISFETIRVSHNGWSTVPGEIELEQWGNYKIIITPEKNGIWCMTTQVIPKLSRNVSYVQAGVPIIYEIENAKKWTYPIVCASMGMSQWVIVVK